jgi:hypothetical protein
LIKAILNDFYFSLKKVETRANASKNSNVVFCWCGDEGGNYDVVMLRRLGLGARMFLGVYVKDVGVLWGSAGMLC